MHHLLNSSSTFHPQKRADKAHTTTRAHVGPSGALPLRGRQMRKVERPKIPDGKFGLEAIPDCDKRISDLLRGLTPQASKNA